MFVVDAVTYVVVGVNVDVTMFWLMSSSMQSSSVVDAIVDSTMLMLMVSLSKRSKSIRLSLMRLLPVLSA